MSAPKEKHEARPCMQLSSHKRKIDTAMHAIVRPEKDKHDLKVQPCKIGNTTTRNPKYNHADLKIQQADLKI